MDVAGDPLGAPARLTLDDATPRPYVGAVNLLLILSALLSALTGAAGGTRAVQPAVAVTRQAEAVAAVRATAATVAPHPVAAPPAMVVVIEGLAWVLAPNAPLFLSRRRE